MACKINEELLEEAKRYAKLDEDDDWSAPIRRRQSAGYIVKAILKGKVCESDGLAGVRRRRKPLTRRRKAQR